MSPGATAFTRIPWGPYSAAIWRVSPAMPALAAVYAACLAMPTIAKPEAMLRMLPRRLRSSGKASRQKRNVLERLALIQNSKSSSEVLGGRLRIADASNVGKHVETAEPGHASFDKRG